MALLLSGTLESPGFCDDICRPVEVFLFRGAGERSPQKLTDSIALRLFLIDQHLIYRRGLATCLANMGEVATVGEAECISQNGHCSELASADVVLVDHQPPGGCKVVREVREATWGQVLICSSRCDEHALLELVEAGAAGYLCKDTLTPEALAAGVRAAASGAGVMPPEFLGSLLRGISRISQEVLKPRGLSLSRLTARERQVLSLVADGHPTREIGQALCYSERTVKNILHDATTKLNARTRSQAVASALREGLI